jgi:hypothetical protein
MTKPSPCRHRRLGAGTDGVLLEPSLDEVVAGLTGDVDTVPLDRGYDSGAVRERLAGYGVSDAVIQRRGRAGAPFLSWIRDQATR